MQRESPPITFRVIVLKDKQTAAQPKVTKNEVTQYTVVFVALLSVVISASFDYTDCLRLYATFAGHCVGLTITPYLSLRHIIKSNCM